MADSLRARLRRRQAAGERAAQVFQRPLAAGFLGGRTVSTPVGGIYVINNSLSRDPITRWPAAGRFEERLQWVYGVGPVTAQKLREHGYPSLVELQHHARFGADANACLAAIERDDTAELLARGASPIELLGRFSVQDIVFLDIETTGLGQGMPLFLAGILCLINGVWTITQFLARTFEEEAALLSAFVQTLAGREVLVTYNGRAFDEPFVRRRMAYHRLRPPKPRLHVDLLHPARRRLARLLPNCRLTTVAEYLLDETRDQDVAGQDIPAVYFEFVRTQDSTLIETVIRHNALDLLALAKIAPDMMEGLS